MQVTEDSASVLAAVSDSILTAVNSGCSSQCSLAANNIRESRLVCCDERKEEIAFQAKIFDIDSNELKSQIQKWVDSQPRIRGWSTLLNVSKSWHFGLSDDTFLESEAKCEEVQTSEDDLSSTSNSDSSGISVPTTILSALLGIVLLVLILSAVLFITIRWYKKKYKYRETSTDEDRYEVTEARIVHFTFFLLSEWSSSNLKTLTLVLTKDEYL